MSLVPFPLKSLHFCAKADIVISIYSGKISNLNVSPSDDSASQTATVTFEKETAARTALLLDNTQLGPNQVQVTSDDSKSLDDLSKDAPAAPGVDTDSKKDASGSPDSVAQEDKPRSRIVAEYLANGYTISDKAIERAIALDKQHGISARFMATLKDFDQRYIQSGERARAADTKFGVTEKATEAWRGMHSYFDRVLDTPTGRQIRTFYETGEKQVLDVHNEARHLADLKSGKKTSDGKLDPEVIRGANEVAQTTEKTAVPGVDKSA